MFQRFIIFYQLLNISVTRFLLSFVIFYWASVPYPLYASEDTTYKPKANVQNTYALVIGISQYQNDRLPKLPYAAKDAGLFADYLQSRAGGSLPPDHLRLLRNEEATIASVYEALDWLKENCRPDDEAIIYFSGHGDVETNDTTSLGYLIAYNSPPNNYRNNAIALEDLNQAANSLTLVNKGKVVLITDACHSGKLAGDFYKGKQLVGDRLRLVLNNEVRLTACAKDQLAAEGPEWGGGRGVFSYYLIRGLQGLADSKTDGIIQLQELSHYLDSAFKADPTLARDNHSQQPVTDGNPYFPLAEVDPQTLMQLHSQPESDTSSMPSGLATLMALQPLELQPIDQFFRMAEKFPFEKWMDFSQYQMMEADSIPNKLVRDGLVYLLYEDSLTQNEANPPPNGLLMYLVTEDTLKLLEKQLLGNNSLKIRFNEKLIRVVHKKVQEMVNAYLEGDLNELEKRQYYYSGDRGYENFLSLVDLAIRISPPDHYLVRLLKVQKNYLAGLLNRLEMATHQNTDSLLRISISYQREALQSEPYAAYIQNEMGNLMVNRKDYDSADYHFSTAIALAPSWAIPWSNRIRMNLARGNLAKAKEAIQKADSLQPNLAYVLLNAGLVMEKEGDLLAAESYYLKAIRQNPVHYLPYERLGKIYLETGRYEKADQFIHDAQIRKADFAVNNHYFEFGVELGGMFLGPKVNEAFYCLSTMEQLTPANRPYFELLKGLEILMSDSNENKRFSMALASLINIKKSNPGIILADHYIGLIYSKQGHWELAEQHFKEALKQYPVPEGPIFYLMDSVFRGQLTSSDSCLVNRLMNFTYDNLDDLYLLARIYEDKGLFDKALDQYQKIEQVENERQTKQAGFEGFPDLDQEEINWQLHEPGLRRTMDHRLVYVSNPMEELMHEYEDIHFAGGVYKQSRIYEKLGLFEKAEEALLRQIAFNHVCGNMRFQLTYKNKIGISRLTGIADIFYWLNLNQAFEIETRNFYRRMILREPRDPDWNEHAGLFLYQRLKMAFDRTPQKLRVPFYHSIKDFDYPWLGNEESPDTSDLLFILPGTGEEIKIEKSIYDPVRESLDLLQESVRLSGSYEPKMEILEALADLNSWVGNTREAISAHEKLVSRDPGNAAYRRKLIEYLVSVDEFPKAREQLDSLKQYNQENDQQELLLIKYDILSGSYIGAENDLKNFTPPTPSEKQQQMILFANLYLITGKYKKAIQYLADSIQIEKIAAMKIEDDYGAGGRRLEDNYELEARRLKEQRSRLYSIARINAITRHKKDAFIALKKCLDEGFEYQYVLDNDEAWKRYRRSRQWNDLLKLYSFTDLYQSTPVAEFRNPVGYRIPKLHIEKGD